ncbi:MAG: hypothetical protein AB7P03_02690 [Kofleriaceae bacterium]
MRRTRQASSATSSSSRPRLDRDAFSECVRNAPYAVELGRLSEQFARVRIHNQIVFAGGEALSDGIDYALLRESELTEQTE